MQSCQLDNDGLLRKAVSRRHLDQLPHFGKLRIVFMCHIEVDADCEIDEVEVCPTDEGVPHLVISVLAFEGADHHASMVHCFKLIAVNTFLKLSCRQHPSPLLVIVAEESDTKNFVLSILLALLGEESKPTRVHPDLTPYGHLVDHKVEMLFRLKHIPLAYVGAYHS